MTPLRAGGPARLAHEAHPRHQERPRHEEPRSHLEKWGQADQSPFDREIGRAPNQPGGGEARKDQRAQTRVARGGAVPRTGIIHHHTRQRFSRTIGWPALHENVFSNSGMFTTKPLTRYLPGECASVRALARRSAGRWFSQAHCAYPTKKRCSGVKPSRASDLVSAVSAFQAIQASTSPPRSAMSSPSVSLLLILISSTIVYCAY